MDTLVEKPKKYTESDEKNPGIAVKTAADPSRTAARSVNEGVLGQAPIGRFCSYSLQQEMCERAHRLAGEANFSYIASNS